jgi:hypothetical protein
MRQLAEAGRCPLPLADLAFNHLLAAAASGHGQRDWGAISLAVRAEAGLPLPGAVAAAVAAEAEATNRAGGRDGGSGGGGGGGADSGSKSAEK